jgi:hypothetical protein
MSKYYEYKYCIKIHYFIKISSHLISRNEFEYFNIVVFILRIFLLYIRYNIKFKFYNGA